MLSRGDERAIRVRPTHVFNNMVRLWVEPVRNTLERLDDALDSRRAHAERARRADGSHEILAVVLA